MTICFIIVDEHDSEKGVWPMTTYFIIVDEHGFENRVSFKEWDAYEGTKFMRAGTGVRLDKAMEKIMAGAFRAGVYE